MSAPAPRSTTPDGRARIPIITLVLLAANLIAATAVFLDLSLLDRLAFHAEAPNPLQAFVSLFVHANMAHLLGNMIFLAAVGAAVEIATGWPRYLLVYFVSGFAGILLYWITVRRLPDPAPLVGASGAVAGLAGYYSLRYHSLRVLVAPNRAVSTTVVTGIWFLLQLIGAVVALGGRVPGVAFFAHLGGFVTGLILAVVLRAPDFEQLRLGHEVLERMNDRGPDAVAEAAREHLREHPNDPTALQRLAEALHDLGETDQESEVRLAQIRIDEGDGRRIALKRLLELDPSKIAARRKLQMADLVRDEDRGLAARLLRSIVNDAEATKDHPDALLALAELSEPPDPETLGQLQSRFPLSDAVELARRKGLLV